MRPVILYLPLTVNDTSVPPGTFFVDALLAIAALMKPCGVAQSCSSRSSWAACAGAGGGGPAGPRPAAGAPAAGAPAAGAVPGTAGAAGAGGGAAAGAGGATTTFQA